MFITICRHAALIMFSALLFQAASSARAEQNEAFIWPGNGAPADRTVWGFKDGIRIGLSPTRGPEGLIRIYAPYLDQKFPRVINFLSIEPAVKGKPGRGQSELEISKERPGERGLSFRASNSLDEVPTIGAPLATGAYSEQENVLRVYVHTETFDNGAKPIVELVFEPENPYQVEIITHAATDSAEMTQMIVSATMGNYALLRQVKLKERTFYAGRRWRDTKPGNLGFLDWQTWGPRRLNRLEDGRYLVAAVSNLPSPALADYARSVPRHWLFKGKPAAQFWATEADARPTLAVNGRKKYWGSEAPIPGGPSIENFELRTQFKPGRKFWFGVVPLK